MASINKVVLIGNLGHDPSVRQFSDGQTAASISLATTDRWRDKETGQDKEATEWHRVVFRGRLAEIAAQYLRKGAQVYIEGSLHTRKWADPESDQERYVTEVQATQMQMLGQRPRQQAPQAADDGYGDYTP